MPIKRTNSHALEDQSLRRIAAVFEAKRWTVERITRDYGEDLLVRVFADGDATPLLFFVQAKAFSSTRKLVIRRGEYLSVPVDPAHLESWRGFREPVILAVWDAATDVVYWQSVQTALSVAERRAEWKRRKPPRARLWIPTENILDSLSVSHIEARAHAAWYELEREREGARVLIAALRDQLGLTVSFEPRHGIVAIPEGQFVPAPEGGERMYPFGRFAREIKQVASILGVSPEEAFNRTMEFMLGLLRQVMSGKPAVATAPDGRLVEIFKDADAVGEDFLRAFEHFDLA